MHSEKPKQREWNKNPKVFIAGIAVIFLVLAFVLANNNGITGNLIKVPNTISMPEKVSLAELENDVYPKFICSCCGNTIDQCDCETAEGMKEYINTLAGDELSKDDIVVEATKKFGLSSLADDLLKEYVQKKIAEKAPADKPIISIEPSVYDFGAVSQSKGVVSALFEIRNNVNSELIISKIDTSCMCTTASIINDGEEGPVFGMGMHGNNPTGWSTIIKPGRTAQLKVYYDPNAHGKFSGLVTRAIDVFSNDPVNFQKQVKIELNQVE